MKDRHIPWAKPTLKGREAAYAAEAVESSWISGGGFIDRFEREFAAAIDAEHCITTCNGTAALQLAMLALDLKAGDEVIVPGFTFAAAANMVLAMGGKPIFADVCESTWCIDPKDVAARITVRTRGIVPVHLYGNVCEMASLMALAGEHDLWVIEDAAEAALSRYHGRAAGCFGAVGCFSFQATKTLAMGEGGAVVTGDRALHKRMQLIRNHGMQGARRYWHDVVGFNFRLTNMQAAVGCAQLESRDAICSARAQMDRHYRERLGNVPGLSMQQKTPGAEPVVWAITVRLDRDCFGDRDAVMAVLAAAGIETRPGFYSFDRMPLYEAPRLPVAGRIAEETISLPSFPELTAVEIDYVCDRLLECHR
jgi:perosamine synthetase